MTKSTDGELILYQTEDRRTRIECRFEGACQFPSSRDEDEHAS